MGFSYNKQQQKRRFLANTGIIGSTLDRSFGRIPGGYGDRYGGTRLIMNVSLSLFAVVVVVVAAAAAAAAAAVLVLL